jgi:ATP-binding cassette, subfamily A (ABC1), member 3
MFENQITVLLGHNGAGKTTTMSMLTGMLPPTVGTAVINGQDIRTGIDRVRCSLGLCPQYNILFDELTVREHIEFYSRLKGMKLSAVKTEVHKYVKTLQLDEQIDQKTKCLSGGMRRKLSVGVALCADSKVVICDEPTSGVDPAARRAIWNLLLKEKKGRTILLSTHSMDEADVLGDRIAIMAGGILKTVGSSFFLKKKFGGSALLVCVKEAGCEVENTTRLLQKYIPDVVVKANVSGELSYLLNDENVGIFQAMLEDLEANAYDLKLSSFGISPATMEEVFMNVGSDAVSCENVDYSCKV